MSGYRDELEALSHENHSLRQRIKELEQQLAHPTLRPPARPSRVPWVLVAILALVSLGAVSLLAVSKRLAERQMQAVIAVSEVASRAAPLPPAVAPHAELRVSILGDRSMVVEGRTLTDEAFRALAEQTAQRDRETRVIIASDRTVAYARVIQVINLVRSAGLNRFAMQVDQPP